MEKHEQTRYVKRTQKNYSMPFKLQIVQEIEQGQLTATEATKKHGIQCRKTVVEWLKKFGNFDWENKTPFTCQSHQNKRSWSLKPK